MKVENKTIKVDQRNRLQR